MDSKVFLKRIQFASAKILDVFFCILIVPVALIFRFYRHIGVAKLSLTTNCLKKIGIYPLLDHYYEPLFNHRLLKHPLDAPRNLPGVNLDVESQLQFLALLNHSSELEALELDKKTDRVDQFYINNGYFNSGDAEFLYQIIRYIKPARILEIGSGHSTKIARISAQKNDAESGKITRHLCIEPFEKKWLDDLDDIQLIREKVEDINHDMFRQLEAGDLLFIDSSHMIRPQGDVLLEFLEIIPVLNAGVYIHIHDIFTPADYPGKWVIDNVKFWNEQYLLEALLSNSERYEVVAALNFLKNNHFDSLKAVCPYLDNASDPVSFYIRVKR